MALPQTIPAIAAINAAATVTFLFLRFGAGFTGGIAGGEMNMIVSRPQCGQAIVCPSMFAGKLMCPLQCRQLHFDSVIVVFLSECPAVLNSFNPHLLFGLNRLEIFYGVLLLFSIDTLPPPIFHLSRASPCLQ